VTQGTSGWYGVITPNVSESLFPAGPQSKAARDAVNAAKGMYQCDGQTVVDPIDLGEFKSLSEKLKGLDNSKSVATLG
jgi:hypothetical protein